MTTYHEGELAVQERAGVRDLAERVGSMVSPTIPPPAREFLRDRSWVLAGSVGADGRVWASILSGAPGSFRAEDERTVRLDARPRPSDPLADALSIGAPIGLLAMDLASRRRMRLNGTVDALDEGGIRVRAAQVYANCPKYIQARVPDGKAGDAESEAPSKARRASGLTAAQRAWIERADTFFIATAHPTGGADVSHRGGQPGFVRVSDAATLVIPDYAGNNMFQTLGNLTTNPAAGLLFVDFEQGRTLQLTGRARIDWDQVRASRFPGADRLLDFRIDGVVETEHALPLRWRLVEYSPFNPL